MSMKHLIETNNKRVPFSAASWFVGAALLLSGAANAQETKFESRTFLSAAQEVADPAVDSAGSGRAIVRFDAAFTEAVIRVRFSDLVGTVTRVHFHCAGAGANGPIALGLIDTVDPASDNSDNITLDEARVRGTITNEDFPDTDACAGTIGQPVNNLISLAAAIDAGLIYWNLHTDSFPAGELRGQARPASER